MNKNITLIKNAFKEYFKGEHKLPSKLTSKGSIKTPESSWSIKYILLEDENGHPYLDFTAYNRFTNTRHQRIDCTGTITSLETFQDAFVYDPDIPGDEEIKQKEYYEHNRKVSKMLIEKGLGI